MHKFKLEILNGVYDVAYILIPNEGMNIYTANKYF